MNWFLVLYVAVTVIATIALTVIVCRYRVVHHKRVSFGTLFSCPTVANLAIFLVMCFWEQGSDVFTYHFWFGTKEDAFQILIVFQGSITILCILPAIGVVAHYQRRIKKHGATVV